MSAAPSTSFASSERRALCDLLDELGPDAPTLTPAWTTLDLAAYLWIRENDLLGASGTVAKPLAGLLERRLDAVKPRWPFPELVQRVRTGPAWYSPYVVPGIEQATNTSEFFVRHEDVRRAGEPTLGPRTLDADVEDWMWRRLKLLGRTWFKRVQVGVLLERANAAPPAATRPGQPAEPATLRVVPGATIVTLIGQPSELLLFAYGRARAAAVEVIGEPEAIEVLYATDRAS